jgi:putative endonuclease
MATVYILYSQQANSYYIGSCKDLAVRLEQHSAKEFKGFTSNNNDWNLYYSIDNLEYEIARNVEQHIKKMKSKKYIENLTRFPEITEKLLLKYSAGSSRWLSGPALGATQGASTLKVN